jgi:hypothetical protein
MIEDGFSPSPDEIEDAEETQETPENSPTPEEVRQALLDNLKLINEKLLADDYKGIEYKAGVGTPVDETIEDNDLNPIVFDWEDADVLGPELVARAEAWLEEKLGAPVDHAVRGATYIAPEGGTTITMLGEPMGDENSLYQIALLQTEGRKDAYMFGNYNSYAQMLETFELIENEGEGETSDAPQQ